jgi:hypothetical protein
VAREDAAVVEEAARTFDAMGLAWHAQQTRDRRAFT